MTMMDDDDDDCDDGGGGSGLSETIQPGERSDILTVKLHTYDII